MYVLLASAQELKQDTLVEYVQESSLLWQL